MAMAGEPGGWGRGGAWPWPASTAAAGPAAHGPAAAAHGRARERPGRQQRCAGHGGRRGPRKGGGGAGGDGGGRSQVRVSGGDPTDSSVCTNLRKVEVSTPSCLPKMDRISGYFRGAAVSG